MSSSPPPDQSTTQPLTAQPLSTQPLTAQPPTGQPLTTQLADPSGTPQSVGSDLPPAGSAGGGTDGRVRRPLTLRSKLIVWIVALITVVCAVIGVTTEVYLSRYLIRQVDSQLIEIHDIANGPDRSRGGASGGTPLT